MNATKAIFLTIMSFSLIFSGCSLSRSVKGGAIGTVSGGAAGAVIGRASGNTAMGAVIGATVGGVTGAIIGNQMDKQAAEIEKEVPGAEVKRVGEGIVIEFKNDVLFAFDASSLRSDAKDNLDKLDVILTRYSDTNIEIHGHTDNTGTELYNQSLSERRTNTVSGYLLGKGIVSGRLRSIGYGETEPKYSNETVEGRSKNRRVEFAITANEKMIRESQ